MTDRITQTHTYGPDGLLKESKETDSFFLKKGTGVMVSYIIKRPYDDSRNLIKERKFATDPQKLMHEKIIQYDKNNNMILSIEKWENVVWSVTKKIFNDKNRLTKQIEIKQRGEGSIYDTLTAEYFYDKNGDRYIQRTILYFSRDGQKIQ